MSNEYYVVLHHAKKNIGDFLIRDRAKKLLQYVRPDRELVEFPSWESLQDKLGIVNGAQALIIMGGPGLGESIYPKSYPLVENLDDIKVPMVLMGSGSYARVFNAHFIKNFKFSSLAQKFINKVKFIGLRDNFSQAILTNRHITSEMTGCPVWYDLDCLGKELKVTNNKSIIFTPPANMLFKQQCIDIMEMIAKQFAGYKIYSSFNRGFTRDKHTTKAYEDSISDIVKKGEQLGFENIDCSYDLEKIDIYNACDFHIGYRLHSHIHFMSRRAPSFLISEDSRSNGLMESIGLPILQGEKNNLLSNLFSSGNRYIKYAIGRFASPVKVNPELPEQLLASITREIENEFLSFRGIESKLDWMFENRMKKFLRSLP